MRNSVVSKSLTRPVAAERRVVLQKPMSAAVRQSLRKKLDGVFEAAQTRLNADVSPDGLSKLDRFIREQVKPRIKIYGDMPH